MVVSSPQSEIDGRGRAETAAPALLRYTAPGRPTANIVADILRVLFPDARTAIDLTPGRGCFWSETVPIRVSVEMSEGDFTMLPYADASYDVAVFDPPHLADAGEDSIMGRRYGTYRDDELEGVVRQGTREAWRVVRLGAVVKVTDAIHCSRYTRMSGWVYDELGEPYDVVHQVRSRSLVDPKWGPQLSAYNNGATYLIFRKDGPLHRRRCEIVA